GGAVHDAAMHAKAHDAARELIHDDQHPVGPQHCRLAAKQVETPQTVLRVTEHGEPGRPSRVWLRPVPRGENAPHDILVDGDVEAIVDLDIVEKAGLTRTLRRWRTVEPTQCRPTHGTARHCDVAG